MKQTTLRGLGFRIKGMRDDSRIAQTRTGKEGRIEKPLQSVDSIRKKSKEGYNNYYLLLYDWFDDRCLATNR